MPIFSIYGEHSLGVSHSGEINVGGEGEVELTDEEVQQLVQLIRENNGETDVEKLRLMQKYPEIYEQLNDAYGDAARSAEYNHWVIEGYENGYYEISEEEAIAKCEEEYGYKFVFDKDKFLEEHEWYDPDEIKSVDDLDEDELYDAKVEAFSEWVEEYRSRVNEDEEAYFLATVFEIDVNLDGVDYTVEIPPEIVKMAKEGFA